MKRITIFIALLLLAGCSALTGEEVGRLAINHVSSEETIIKKDATVTLKQGDEIVLWSDMDMEYEGEVSILFRVSISRDGKVLDVIEVDPRAKDMTISEVKASMGGKTKWSFSGRNAVFPIATDGSYTFEAILIASQNASLLINKAELVIKKI